MLDTIKLSIPTNLSEGQIANIGWTQTNTNTNVYKSDTTVYKKIYDSTVSGTPNIQLTYREQTPTVNWLKVEVSIPKFLFGSNVFEVKESDIPLFYSKLKKHISEQLKIDIKSLPKLENCRVDKLHICKNFNVGILLQDYLRAMNNTTMTKYSARVYKEKGSNNIQTVEWKCGSRKIKLYDKEAEVIANGLSDTPIASKAKGMLRFEIELSTADLKKINTSRIASEVLKESIVTDILQKTLDEIGLGQGVQISSLQQVINTINQQTSLKARSRATLIAFATDLIMNGEMKCRKTYSKSTFQRNFKNLKTVLGLEKIILSPTILPPLSVDGNKKTASVFAEQKTVNV